MFKNVVFPLLILSSVIDAELKRKSGSLRHRTDHSKPPVRRSDSHHTEPSDYSTEGSDRRTVDLNDDHSKIATDRFEDDSFEPRGRRMNFGKGSTDHRIVPSSCNERTTPDTAITKVAKLNSPVSSLEPDITFEDFDVQNEELRVYVNKLRKRITRLKHIKV